ncbi:MAG: aldehyde dehydrogenase family protein [Parasphingorhabdus sp.]|uniref:aldehyde dehydrogenase family protein n=1 Tax=Parasphingorhabdus sp. TaxID=2709688 RepID=UPI003001EDAD
MEQRALELPCPQMVIGGSRLDAQSGATIGVEDPSNGTILTQVPEGSAADVDHAVKVARAAFDSPSWSRMRPLDRGKILESIARLIEANAEQLALIESYDNGKSYTHALAFDIPAAVDTFRYYAGTCARIEGKVNPISADGRQYHSYTKHEPIGVVGSIVPWNFPIVMAAMKIAPALAAGCAIILKPSEVTPLTALRLAELVLEAGLPEGILNVVTGYGHIVGQAMVDHPGINKIAFTGSTRVGKSILRSAAETVKPVTLELGGKSPSLIFADANIDAAGIGAALAIFFNSGQVCVAASRLYVEESIFDDVLAAVVKAAESFPIGDGRDANTMIGPLVSHAQQERVLGYIDAGVKEGGQVLTGGKKRGETGYYVEPTVFINTKPDAKIVREEIFGPVLVATPFKDVEDVIAEANDTNYGLAANIWTRDLSRAHLTAARLQAGTVWINSHAIIDPAAAFGGYKESGLGREMSDEGLHAYTQSKTVTAFLGD